MKHYFFFFFLLFRNLFRGFNATETDGFAKLLHIFVAFSEYINFKTKQNKKFTTILNRRINKTLFPLFFQKSILIATNQDVLQATVNNFTVYLL